MNCISEGVLRAYHDRELEAAELASVEKHLGECSTCRAHAEQLSTTALHVSEHLGSLEASPRSFAEENPQIALTRFKANLPVEPERVSFLGRIFAGQRRFAWAASLAAAILAVSLVFPSARSFAQRLLDTLRIEKVQTVTLDMGAFNGPQNHTLQEALGQMMSENVVVTANEKPLSASSREEATTLAGFPIRLPLSRTDSPQFHVEGSHAFHMTVDRSRLQEILDQSGRTDLILPAKLDGAAVSVQIPRSVEASYGDCHHRNASLEPQNSQPAPTTSADCVFLVQAPSPVVNVPAELNLQQLAETALQLAGMSPVQARQFCQTVDWRTTLVIPVPPSVRSYETVTVDGAQGTLMHIASHRGPTPAYVLIWVKGGVIYALFGSGDSNSAVQLANSLD